MTKTDNLYIEALKEGRNRMKEGITFDDLRGYLENNGFNDEFRNADFLHYFNFWFYNNFYHKSITFNLKVSNGNTQYALNNTHSYDRDKCIMTGEAYENLIDFENLQEARKSSKQSYTVSIWAIVISAVFAAIQIILAIIKP